ncbi:MAG: NYN domain-containing protein [Longicatena sp.]
MVKDKRYAILIDADNISDKYIKVILDEISNYGVATYKRIYGDWTKPGLNSWKSVLLEHSVTPIQQYGYTTGKNATDSAMIIDAMDILYAGHVEGFCLVTSDSDFTRLASRMRESGMDVIGMGEKKTPKPFISSCNKFKYLDVLEKAIQIENKKNLSIMKLPDYIEEEQPAYLKNESTSKNKNANKGIVNDLEIYGNIDKIKKTILKVVQDNSDEDEWTFIGDLGNQLQKRYPDFDVRNFGFRKFAPFIESLNLFEIKTEVNKGTNGKLIYLREKGE